MRNSRLIKVLGALFALSLLAAACGDDSSDDSASDSTEDTSSQTTEAESTTESTEAEATVPEDSAEICTADGLAAAVEAGPEAGTLEGMTEDPVATAATNNPVLTQTAMAVDAAGLVETLNNAEDITVFAPTDCAFAEAPQDVIDMALADPTGLLAQVLKFHVVQGTFTAEDLASQTEPLPTLNGAPLSVSTEGEDVVLNDGMATVQVPDIETENATVHLIDTVMLPPEG